MIENIPKKETPKKEAVVRVVSDGGTGRSFIVLHEPGVYTSFATSLAAVVADKARAILLETDVISDDNWSQLSDAVLEQLQILSIRQASFIGFGAAGSLIQNLYLVQPRLIRTAVLIDASTRPHPDFLTRSIDKLENLLPLGLPLRKHQRGFDSKPFLHRIRCPTLVVISSKSTAYQRSEAEVLNSSLPTSWLLKLESDNEVLELEKNTISFQEVPAKRPQKNLRG